MSNIPPQSHSSTVEAIYAQLNQHDIEQFSAGYQRWNLQQQIAALETRLDSLRQQIVENTERMQAIHPTAIALAALARLQANGVSDIELLDRMLEQGEMWLDRTMQRLNYCEQLDDFIRDDYTQWCQHALEGAYDWIDSMLDGSHSSFPTVASEEEELAKATEESFLRKLGSDEDEQDEHGAVMLEMETTHKRQAITIAHSEDTVSPVEDIPSEVEVTSIAEETIPGLEEAFAGDVTDIAGEIALPLPEGAINRAPTDGVSQESEEYIPLSEEPTLAEPIFASTRTQPAIEEYIALEESLFDGDVSSPEGDPTAIQEYIAFEEPFTFEGSANPDAEEPALQEYVIPESGEEMQASDIVGEVALPLPGGAINLAPTGEASLRSPGMDGTSPAVSVPDNAESVIQEYVIPEEPLSVESSAISGSEQPNMQALDEIAPITEDSAFTLPEPPLQSEEFVPPEAHLSASQADVAVSMQADSVEPSQTMVTQPPRRRNFLVRLLAKLFGR